jgi:hypothetical protein
MSDPKRYTASVMHVGVREDPQGALIAYDHYARLKAEVERLKEDNRQLTNAFEIAEGIIKRMGKAAEAAAKEGKSSV